MRFIVLGSVLLLSACNVMPRYDSLETYLQSKRLSPPSIESISHCHGYGCKFRQDIALTKKEWRTIKSPVSRKARSASKERQNIAKSIARFEKIIGNKAGTHSDIAKTFTKMGDYQLDCADESVNTTLYLKLLDAEGLLHFHEPHIPVIRGFSNGGSWFHETAVIKEIKSEEYFAVDSWWRDNAKAPYIVSLEEWKSGWRAPEEKN